MTWFAHFDNVHTILFVTALSSYDQVLVEDPTVNRLIDSIVLFEQITSHPLLTKKSFILFLNKRDLFEKKIRKIHLDKFFPEYS
ncbi:Guanine nucleotide-binding protein G(t) subunit alpha-2, partial [Kappamyces sp. JEL0680]